MRFRNPRVLPEAVADVRAGLAFLRSQGLAAVALTGHSFGGAVVIQAAADVPLVRAAVTLVSQSYGTEAVGRLGPHCALLLLHGEADRVLSARCSMQIHGHAHEPKRLVLYKGTDHLPDEVAEDVYQEVYAWITEHLIAGRP